MDLDDKFEKEMFSCECSCCFVCFCSEYQNTQLCEYCVVHPEITVELYRAKRIDRIFDIIGSTSVRRFPDILKMVWEEVRDKE
jgi:hypothetical protein